MTIRIRAPGMSAFILLFSPFLSISIQGYITTACSTATVQKATGHPTVSTNALPRKIPKSIPPPNPSDMIPLAM